MSWRSITALLILAFAGGAAGFAWLSSQPAMPWAAVDPVPTTSVMDAEETDSPAAASTSFAVPTIVQPSGSQAEAMLLVQNVRRAIETGKPLGDLGSRLQLTFGQSQPKALVIVANGARKTVSNAELLDRFDTIAPQLGLPVGTTWDRMQYEFNTLFVLRSGNALPTAAAARIDTIRAQIIAGDIAGAAKLIRIMPGAALASGWLADAARAISVHQALDQLYRAAATPVAPSAPIALPAPPLVLAPTQSETPAVSVDGE